MKNTIFTILSAVIFSVTIYGQGTAYDQGMQKAFGLWEENKAMEASALFERIGEAEKDNWIPYYHAANALISSSFNMEDKSKRNEVLKKAKTIIETAHKLSPDNSELITLEGVLYTGYVAMDPETYGMQYSSKIMGLHGKALELDPKNPRAQLNKIEYEIGTARFFGQDLGTFCGPLSKTRPLFENQDSSVPYAPSYGIQRLDPIMAQCGCE